MGERATTPASPPSAPRSPSHTPRSPPLAAPRTQNVCTNSPDRSLGENRRAAGTGRGVRWRRPSESEGGGGAPAGVVSFLFYCCSGSALTAGLAPPRPAPPSAGVWRPRGAVPFRSPLPTRAGSVTPQTAPESPAACLGRQRTNTHRDVRGASRAAAATTVVVVADPSAGPRRRHGACPSPAAAAGAAAALNDAPRPAAWRFGSEWAAGAGR